MMLLLCVALLAAAAQAVPQHAGEQLLRLHVRSEHEARLLHGLEASAAGMDFWGHAAPGRDVDVRVESAYVPSVRRLLQQQRVAFDVLSVDLQALVEQERMQMLNVTALKGNNMGYLSSAQMNGLMYKLERQAPGTVTVVKMGESFEGRDLLVLRVTAGDGRVRPAAFINSGFHSREWIASASTVWMMNEFATNSKRNEAIARALQKFDWYFLPMANPDGYEFSREENRFWRKTRSSGFFCDGADPNRNWDAHFGGVGTSGFPCSDQYRGKHAFSEPETLAQSQYLKQLLAGEGGLAMYFDLHCFSQLWFVPFGNDEANKPADDAEMRRVAHIGAAAIRQYGGREFTVGQPPEILYAATGGAFDWAKMQGVKYSYAMELRPQGFEHGAQGFITPASEIPDSGRETMTGILAAADATQL